MIVGSGLIARAFMPYEAALGDVCVYAAGVSNSACADAREYEREHRRLGATLDALRESTLLLYFSTCSINDPAAQASPYVVHKRAMEQFVARRPRHLVVRLPQLAGRTPNPHTLLNYLYARIARSERFKVARGAERNIIDVDDVASVVLDLVKHGACAETINVASAQSTSIFDIVQCMEEVVGRRALFDILDAGAGYVIDIARIRDSLTRSGVSFPTDYLRRTLEKYYGSNATIAT